MLKLNYNKYSFAVKLTHYLGHKAYEPGTDTFRNVVAHFGEHLVAEDGTINRKILGGIVFGDQAKLKELTYVCSFFV